MKKEYNVKYEKYIGVTKQILELSTEIETLQNKISKLSIKKKNLFSLVDNDFFTQFKENSNRVPKDLISFMFKFFGYTNHHYKSVNSLYNL